MGTEALRGWRPSREEVDRILAEMRPIIAELAQRQALAPEPVRPSAA